MTDRYERIRKALEMEPTPGPWEYDENADGSCPLVYGANETPVLKFDQGCPYDYDPSWDVEGVDAAYIAACDPDTIRALLEERDRLAAALEAARADAARWRFVAQFMQLDDVGDDQYCLGLIVNYEALEDMVTAQSARLDGERRRLEWADVQGPEDSPKTLPPITLDAAIDAAIDAAMSKEGK